MQHTPLIHQYIDAMNNPYGLFRTLDSLTVERDDTGELFYRAGNYSVIFKVHDTDGKNYALKCYTRIPPRLQSVYDHLGTGDSAGYWTRGRYLPDEIYIHTSEEEGCYYPVVLMEWVDGELLGRHAGRLCRTKNRTELYQLAVAFDRMARHLLTLDVAHGDLKQDNIVVTHEGKLQLIDYDGAYLPCFAGYGSSVLGSPAYQHPKRDRNFFNKHIDDYSMALIALSLHALADEPDLFFKCHDGENLIFDAEELNTGHSEPFQHCMSRWDDEGRTVLIRLGQQMTNPSPTIDHLDEMIAALDDTLALQEADSKILHTIDDTNIQWAIINHHGRFGYADLNTHTVRLQPIYLDALPFSEQCAVVRTEKGWRVIDSQGRCVIDCSQYQMVEPFRFERAMVRRNNRYGFIDHQGRSVIEPQYLFASSFHEGLASVQFDNGQFRYIDQNGQIAIAATFDHASSFRKGCATVEQKGHRFKIDHTGSPIFSYTNKFQELYETNLHCGNTHHTV